MSAEVASVLRDAADLIEPPGRWTKRDLAKNRRGRRVDPKSRRAVCWCSLGAIIRCSDSRSQAEVVRRHLLRFAGTQQLGTWNDAQPGPEPVIAALRAAAEEADEA